MAHFTFFIYGDAELRGLRRFAAGSGEFHFEALHGSERFEFGRELQSCRRDLWRGLGLTRGPLDGRWRTRAGDAQVWTSRRHFSERRLATKVGRRVLDRGHNKRSSIRGRLGGGGERRIFSLQPTKQNAPFIGVRRDQADASRRWQKSDSRRIDDLKNVKTESVQREGTEKKSCDGELAPAAWAPRENQAEVIVGNERRVHFGGVVARATEVIPCSSDKLVTSTTSAYGVRRSALMMIGRPSFFAASSNGPSCSSTTF